MNEGLGKIVDALFSRAKVVVSELLNKYSVLMGFTASKRRYENATDRRGGEITKLLNNIIFSTAFISFIPFLEKGLTCLVVDSWSRETRSIARKQA